MKRCGGRDLLDGIADSEFASVTKTTEGNERLLQTAAIDRIDIRSMLVGLMSTWRSAMSIALNDFSITVYGDPYKTQPGLQADYKLKTNSYGTVVGRDPHKIILWFTPMQWKAELEASQLTIPKDLRAFEPGMLRDEVLFHELVHSGRLLDGFAQVNQTLTPNSDDVAMHANDESAPYENIEEFITILVSNIYLSEKGQKVFRASHGGKKYPYILDQAQSSSEGFLAKASNLALVKMFCETDRLAPKLSQINAAFNPVRMYFTKNLFAYNRNASLQ